MASAARVVPAAKGQGIDNAVYSQVTSRLKTHADKGLRARDGLETFSRVEVVSE
jgi:hypothetical protein